MAQQLRPYQALAIERIAASTKRRVLLVAPTGAGKSSILAEIIRAEVERGGRVLAIAHRRELIHQLAERVMLNHGLFAGTIMAGVDPAPTLPIQVASIQTLARRELPEATLCVIDEVHHCRAESYGRVLELYPRVLGATATPIRLDGKGLGNAFEEMIVVAQPKELIAQGYLVPTTGYAYAAPDLSSVSITAGDYNTKGLGLAYERGSVLGDIVGKYVEHAFGKRAICFASSIKNSLTLVAEFRAKGISAEHLDHKSKDRDAIVLRMKSGETLVLSNVGILGEGVDAPGLEVCILARPTKSLSLYLQMVGRVMRPSPDKTHARIHDHSGCVVAHGFPDDDRQWSLSVNRKKPAVPGLRQCPTCFCINAAGAEVCSECGYVWTKSPQEKLMGGAAKELTLEELRDLLADARNRVMFLEQLEQEARAKNYRPGWCVARLKEAAPDAPFPASWWRSSVEGHKGDWRWTQKLN